MTITIQAVQNTVSQVVPFFFVAVVVVVVDDDAVVVVFQVQLPYQVENVSNVPRKAL